MENRINALKWWNKQPKSKRQVLCEFEFGNDRYFNTLTGREIEMLFDNQCKSDAEEVEQNVSGSLPSLMKIYMNANSMKYQDFVEWMRNYNGNAQQI